MHRLARWACAGALSRSAARPPGSNSDAASRSSAPGASPWAAHVAALGAGTPRRPPYPPTAGVDVTHAQGRALTHAQAQAVQGNEEDFVAQGAGARLLKSAAARKARARMLTRVSGVTMLGLGAYVTLAKRAA